MWKKKMLKKCKATNPINEQVTSLYSKETTYLFKNAKTSEEVENARAHNYVCGICKVPFLFCDNFAVHLQTHDNDTSLECSTCTESLDSKKEYYKHLIIHAKKSPKSCNICAKTYITWLRLKCHLDWHDKAFLCHLCDKTFVKNEQLEKHLLVHTAEEYRTCKICNRLKSQSSCVQIAVHSKQPLTCVACGKVFKKKNSLSAHKRMHRFPCQFCIKQFRARVDLVCHIRCIHPEVSLQTKSNSRFNDSHPESSVHIDLNSHLNTSNSDASDKMDWSSHPNASLPETSCKSNLASHYNSSQPESSTQIDSTCRLNTSNPETSCKTDLTSNFNSFHPEASNEIDSTSHFKGFEPVVSDKIDLTKTVKVLIQRLPLKITSYLNSYREASFKADVSNPAS